MQPRVWVRVLSISALLVSVLLGWASIAMSVQASSFTVPPTHAMTAAEVQQRIDAFDEIDRLFRALRFKVVHQRSQDHRGALLLADQMVALSYQLPGLFEEPSARQMFPFSRARPEIWSQSARYQFLMNEFIDNLEDIHDLLKQARMSEAVHRIEVTAQSCRRCHDPFRYRR